jgi:hypothetical protein
MIGLFGSIRCGSTLRGCFERVAELWKDLTQRMGSTAEFTERQSFTAETQREGREKIRDDNRFVNRFTWPVHLSPHKSYRKSKVAAGARLGLTWLACSGLLR